MVILQASLNSLNSVMCSMGVERLFPTPQEQRGVLVLLQSICEGTKETIQGKIILSIELLVTHNAKLLVTACQMRCVYIFPTTM